MCDTDSTSYTTANKTRRVNAALEEIVGLLINADGTWQFDDSNYTTNPVGTIDLVQGQSQYSFQTAFLDIENIKIKDKAGNWTIIDPIDQSQSGVALEQYLLLNGFPIMYDKSGDGLRLYPAPDSSLVTLTAGLKVQFKRTGSLFTTADTTKQPGFASPYHIILAYMASIPYCMAYKQNRIALYQQKVNELKLELIKFYSNREKDKRKVMYARPVSFR